MDTPQVLLEHHLKALRLPTFLREYDKVAQQCAAEGVDFPRYLLRLTELELLDRERRATGYCQVKQFGGILAARRSRYVIDSKSQIQRRPSAKRADSA